MIRVREKWLAEQRNFRQNVVRPQCACPWERKPNFEPSDPLARPSQPAVLAMATMRQARSGLVTAAKEDYPLFELSAQRLRNQEPARNAEGARGPPLSRAPRARRSSVAARP